MLVLSRKMGQKIVIGENITVTVVKLKGNSVRLGFEAPEDVQVLRQEVRNAKQDDGNSRKLPEI